MMMRIARRWIATLALVSTGIAVSTAHERLSSAEQQEGPGAFGFVLAGMRRERDRLVSGTCRFEAVWHADDAAERLSHGSLTIDGGKVRYEMTRPGWVVDRDSIEVTAEGLATAETVPGMHTLKLGYDGTHVNFWHSENNLITVAPQGLDAERRRMAEYFDIRGVVLFDPLSIERGESLEQRFEQLQRLSTREGSGVTMEDDSTWVLRWTAQGERLDSRWSLRVDVTSGFTPMSLKCESRPRGSAGEIRAQMRAEMGGQPLPDRAVEMLRVLEDDPNAWFLLYEATANWEQRDGVWVPVFYELRRPGGLVGRASRTSYAYRWERINEPVDADVFTYATFDLPDNVPVQYVCPENPRWIRPPRGQLGVSVQLPGPRRLILVLALTALVVLVAFCAHWRASRRSV